MFSSDELRFMAVLSRSASLAEVGRELGVTPSAVTQRLQQLERRAGLQLVDRTTRRIALTSEGELVARYGDRVDAELEELVDTLAERRGAIVGKLHILAPFGFGRRWVGPLVGRFCAAHPEIRVELILSDRFDRVPEAAWDVAIQISTPRSTSLEVHELAPNDRVVCGSPALLARVGVPAEPADLRGMPCLAIRENEEDVTLWHFTDPSGGTARVRISPRMSCNDGEVIRRWALDGHGFMTRSEWSVHDDLRAGRLVPVLERYRLPSAPVVALVGTQSRRTARTTALLRELKKAMSPPPWRT